MYKNRLKTIRIENNIKQEEMAELLQMHRGSYSKYEIEDVIMPIKHLNVLCNYFNVSFDYLFGFVDMNNYENSNTYIDIQRTRIRLKEIRKELNLSQQVLSNSLGYAKTTMSGYERGTRIIATPFLYQICKEYKISADYLLGKTDNPKYFK